MGGQNKELADYFWDLGLVMVLAIILVYLLLAAQFSLVKNFRCGHFGSGET